MRLSLRVQGPSLPGQVFRTASVLYRKISAELPYFARGNSLDALVLRNQALQTASLGFGKILALAGMYRLCYFGLKHGFRLQGLAKPSTLFFVGSLKTTYRIC